MSRRMTRCVATHLQNCVFSLFYFYICISCEKLFFFAVMLFIFNVLQTSIKQKVRHFLMNIIDSHSITHHSFAGDLQLQMSALPDNLSELLHSMLTCIDDVSTLATANMLIFNDNKTSHACHFKKIKKST